MCWPTQICSSSISATCRMASMMCTSLAVASRLAVTLTRLVSLPLKYGRTISWLRLSDRESSTLSDGVLMPSDSPVRLPTPTLSDGANFSSSGGGGGGSGGGGGGGGSGSGGGG